MRLYFLDHAPWTPSFTVSAFVFNLRQNDERPSAERLERPVMLDCGLSEASVPDLTLKEDSSVHFVISNNRYMNAGTKVVRVIFCLSFGMLGPLFFNQEIFLYGYARILSMGRQKCWTSP